MNQCGECTECCRSLNLVAEEKYNIKYEWGSECNKLCDKGCSIHHNKPNICNEWLCVYRKYNLDERYRPDRYGMFAEDISDSVVIWPNRHGQRDIDPNLWNEQNKDKIYELMNEISIETKKYKSEYHLQTFNGIINEKTYK